MRGGWRQREGLVVVQLSEVLVGLVREDGEQEDEDRADEEAVRQQRRRQDHLAWRSMDRSCDTCDPETPLCMLCEDHLGGDERARLP